MDDFDTQVQCEEIHTVDEAAEMLAVRIAELEEHIQAARDTRHRDEMSDDYCYSNGKHARHTDRIRRLEAQLAALKKEA
jgi:hypothetical protein